MPPQSLPGDGDIFCGRCLRQLGPGGRDFYEVAIRSLRDPFPPIISAADLERDNSQSWQSALSDLDELSPREALDQVCRQVVLYLCDRCHAAWIEDPAGSGRDEHSAPDNSD